jgi:hypothetical protein
MRPELRRQAAAGKARKPHPPEHASGISRSRNKHIVCVDSAFPDLGRSRRVVVRHSPQLLRGEEREEGATSSRLEMIQVD